LVRPFTLAIRLFANMLAGHLLLLVFGWRPVPVQPVDRLLFAATSFLLTIILTGLESDHGAPGVHFRHAHLVLHRTR